VLDAFFVGKALAETLLERAGEAVSEALSAVGRAEAERDEAIRQFQDDVVNKAREAQRRERGSDDQIR
jgi:vacuolar-type H+-ATPase subunit H